MDPSGRDAGLVLLFRQSEWQRLVVSDIDPPSDVYHYTTAEGFAGIVGEAALRATNVSFLNDPSEVQYGREFALRFLREMAAIAPAMDAGLIRQTHDELRAKVISESYVSCFTELLDDLGQWRAYGTSAIERYAIGFDAHLLLSCFSTRPGGRFARVLYEQEQQEERVGTVVSRALSFVEKNKIDPESLPEVAKVVADVIALHLPQLKDPAYKSEAEWRIIRWHDGLEHDALSFDTSRRVLRPFLPVPLQVPLPITSVQVMAPRRRDAAVKAAEMLLRKANLARTHVSHSAIPFAE